MMTISGSNALAIAAAALVSAALLHTRAVANTPASAPGRLSETGLYTDAGEIAPNARPYSPQYPLWSDGAAKRRWVDLPEGATIDARDPARWVFPVGTRFWKEFSFRGRKVETRFMWRASQHQWVFATYRWNEQGTDAVLAPADGMAGTLELSPGRDHSLPSVDECRACHGAAAPAPLGFTALQLSPDRDPAAIHGEALTPDMLTLGSLVDEGKLSGQSRALVSSPPRIKSQSASARSILGYLLANCGSCHDGRGEIAALAPVLDPRELTTDGDAVVQRWFAQRTRWQVPGAAEGESLLLDVTSPERSALLVRMRSRRPSTQMPPLGTVLRDQVAVDAILEWFSTRTARGSGQTLR